MTALEAAGVETPRLDAELLLAEASGRDRAALAADPEAGIDAGVARRFGEWVRRRVAREPVAYILGRRGFRRIELAVDARVLIPRPETELLVEVAAELEPAAALDVGTGSGAIALALADELPRPTVTATDTSGAALDVAKRNVARLGLEGRVRLELGTVPEGAEFDVVVANLPYVTEAEWPSLEPEITRHEPREALVSGPSGLEAIDSLLATLAADERICRAVALEVGAGQAPAVAGLVRRAGFERVACTPISPGSIASSRGGGERRRSLRRPACARGGVAVFPADGLYGLACDPSNGEAIERIHALKGRDDGKPSAVMFFAPLEMREVLSTLGPRTRDAAGALLPGPVTLVVANPRAPLPTRMPRGPRAARAAG